MEHTTHTASSCNARIQAERARQLWLAVLLQQFKDAGASGKHDIAARQRESAKAWLLGNSLGFRLVCEYAGWDPKVVYDYCQKIFAHKDPGEYLRKHLPKTQNNGLHLQARGPKPKTIHNYSAQILPIK